MRGSERGVPFGQRYVRFCYDTIRVNLQLIWKNPIPYSKATWYQEGGWEGGDHVQRQRQRGKREGERGCTKEKEGNLTADELVRESLAEFRVFGRWRHLVISSIRVTGS